MNQIHSDINLSFLQLSDLTDEKPGCHQLDTSDTTNWTVIGIKCKDGIVLVEQEEVFLRLANTLSASMLIFQFTLPLSLNILPLGSNSL
ncbi:hypothetical protein QL285_083571 [Trifolium repens]|nr:hypothetical protein QL285_083571 [Trifolium repens]